MTTEVFRPVLLLVNVHTLFDCQIITFYEDKYNNTMLSGFITNF